MKRNEAIVDECLKQIMDKFEGHVATQKEKRVINS